MLMIFIKNNTYKGENKMENASKALLIAAAILVVIILIAVGIKIY